MTINNLRFRPYQGLAELEQMKAITIAGRKASLYSGPHIGDLNWWFFYIAPSRGYNLSEIGCVCEDENGRAIGWVFFTPHHNAFDMDVLPEWHGTEREAQIVQWAEAQLAGKAQAEQIPVSAYADEKAHMGVLEKQGYAYAEDFLVIFAQPLDVDLPEPHLPEGFSFLDVMRPAYADKRADVHRNSFNSSRMTRDAYRNFMVTPDYNPELDIVVVAPDGEFAAFAMGWMDAANQLSIFEPVGTRDSMQRRGLGKAALLEGLWRLKARGVRTATVCTHAHNEGNIAFYQSAGFQIVNTVKQFQKCV